jgi:plastocyanin
MGLRRLALFLLTGCLGAAVVVVPGVASSETGPTIEAAGSGGPYPYVYWNPMEAKVGSGGSVTFSNPSSEVSHGVEWKSGPSTPSCSGVPGASAGQPSFGTKWSGACTFSQPGTYMFWCTFHGSKMAASVTVNANGTTTTTTTTTTGATTAPGGGTLPGYGTQPSGTAAPAAGSPLAGSAAEAIKLRSSQHGKAVRGSVAISAAGAGGRLEVDLLATTASLARAGQAGRVRVGKLVRSSLASGTVSFSVALNARARGALRRHRHLKLSVKLIITPAGGAAVTVTRRVTVNA